MLTVPEAARRTGRHPETIRRWIREGKLRASKVGTQHVIEPGALDAFLTDEELPVPASWRQRPNGQPIPNVVRALRLSRGTRRGRGAGGSLSYATTMLTVPEAARRTGKNPETVRRWIREGKLRSHKVGTQHLVDEADLAVVTGDRVPAPAWWDETITGEPMPDWVGILRRQRAGH